MRREERSALPSGAPCPAAPPAAWHASAFSFDSWRSAAWRRLRRPAPPCTAPPCTAPPRPVPSRVVKSSPVPSRRAEETAETMSDPAVCGFLTKTLCARGGRLELAELQQHIGLSAQQLEQTLAAAGPERFLVLGGGDAAAAAAGVLALSAVRLCVRKECGGCERLHLCKLHLMGRCNLGARACKYCHDINTAENKKVLKNHELSGLNEYELRVLLLQNDPFLLPDVCQFYNQGKGTCAQQNCNKLHICRHFLRGECRFLQCKRSHSLLNAHELQVLETSGIDLKTASNFQTICDHKHVEFNKELKKWKSPSSNVPGQTQHQQPKGRGGRDEGKKDDSSAKDSKDNKVDKCDEICLFYVWKYCKHKDKCRLVHYHLPYRWQVHNGITWNDLPVMEEIEKAYCNPRNSSIADKNINFQTMTLGGSSLRRLSTPSSVTKPTFALTTQWIWYWKDDRGEWTEYGEQASLCSGEGGNTNSPTSDIFENLYLADPDATISFQAGLHHYELNFKEMTQTNTHFRTRRKVCRRPKFVSSEDVEKIKKGQKDSSIPNQNCPAHWDQSALPELGYKTVEITNTSSEYNRIRMMFEKTMKSYTVHRIRRIQNPSLWKVFQWQKEQMKKENGGKEVDERLLFHGTKNSFLEAICNHNFDWRICGTNGTIYGKGSYFARDASYSHEYCQPAVKPNVMFVARVLVGDFVEGNASYVRPPPKSASTFRFYDSCVDNVLNPSVFVVFEKYQIYPEYLIEYKEAEKKCILS